MNPRELLAERKRLLVGGVVVALLGGLFWLQLQITRIATLPIETPAATFDVEYVDSAETPYRSVTRAGVGRGSLPTA